jgi:hypothetical protein
LRATIKTYLGQMNAAAGCSLADVFQDHLADGRAIGRVALAVGNRVIIPIAIEVATLGVGHLLKYTKAARNAAKYSDDAVQRPGAGSRSRHWDPQIRDRGTCLREHRQAHLSPNGRKVFVVQFFSAGEKAGQLATAFVPTQKQLTAMLKLLGKA